ncbi:hypothetical protein ACFSO7_00455 [Bacillus sp. CGMCC 1.16607]|uniref:hypothetical protein n=1 Tax=Bacillus sp. CGMCC 1.16607 TaxID=3351842 RepID=UPI0036313EB3
MNDLLLQWGLFSFMIGIFLSLPLAAVHYQKDTIMKRIFVNARKLTSAHIDFFMQAFAIGFVYLLELSMETRFHSYIVIPLVFGTIMNPTILLLEATPFIRSGVVKVVYKLLKAISPVSLMFAWIAISLKFLPMYLIILFVSVVILACFVGAIHLIKTRKQKTNQKLMI